MADTPEEVLDAIDRIIKDVDRKYDECLVEHFIESFDISCPELECRGPEILKRLQFYFEHKSFLMLNQTRAFKILKSILPKSSNLINAQELEKVIPLLDSFWKTLDTIVLNNNSSAMAIVFDLLKQVTTLNEQGFSWTLEREITPPIRLSIPIEDVSSLIKYYIIKCNNYHIKNKAQKLLISIITQNSHHSAMDKFIRLAQELILECSSMGLAIADSGSQLDPQYKIWETIEKSFLINIDKTDVDINPLCKHLAKTNLSHEVVMDGLRSKKKLNGIIYYVTRAPQKTCQFEKELFLYVLYPLLAKFDDEETRHLVNKLMATSGEKDFVKSNMNCKTQTLCLVQLKNIVSEHLDFIWNWHDPMGTPNTIVVTLLNHIRCNYSLNCTGTQVKTMSECCDILSIILEISNSFAESIISRIYMTTYKFLIDIDYNNLTKPIAIKLLKLMLLANKTYVKILSTTRLDKIDDIFLKTVELAYKFQDSELLNEFTLFFGNAFSSFTEELVQESYVRLVFDHIYHHTKDTEHRELLGNLAGIFIAIDLEAEDATLSKLNIKRYHDVPIIISDIIEQNSAIPTTIEKIISNICTMKSRSYIEQFSCPEVREKFSKALTLVIRSDSSETIRLQTFILISHLIDVLIQENSEAEKVLDKLLSTNILKTLYQVSTGDMYSPNLLKAARKGIDCIKEKVIFKLDNLTEIVMDKDLVNFYTSHEEYCEEKFTQAQCLWVDEIKSSYVKDILSESGKGISECY